MAKKDRKFERRKSEIHGNGVFATELIRKGERLVRYKGKLRTHEEVDERYGAQDEDGHTFLFTLNDDYVIDANEGGNIARWINHSCAPNCEALLEENGKGKRHKDKVFIEALRDIEPGEELSYNYGITLEEDYTPELKTLWGCRCGTPGCTGTMLQPKAEKKAAGKKAPAKQSKGKKSAGKKAVGKKAAAKEATKKAIGKKAGTNAAPAVAKSTGKTSAKKVPAKKAVGKKYAGKKAV